VQAEAKLRPLLHRDLRAVPAVSAEDAVRARLARRRSMPWSLQVGSRQISLPTQVWQTEPRCLQFLSRGQCYAPRDFAWALAMY
jgi:hypothetical protein